MVNKLATLLPLLLIITATPTLANGINNNRQVQIAENPPAQKPENSPVQKPSENNQTEISITPAQKAKLDKIVSSSVTKIKAVLTPAQLQSLNGGETLATLKLTASQQAKIKAIQQANDQQVLSILTPEQKAKIKARK
jgi:Spy/CpxP family protein refolding chaperone